MGIKSINKRGLLNKKGFALIEFVVVLAVVSIMLPAIFTLYLVSIQNQQKAKILTHIKQNGDNALSIMESLIRNRGVSIYDAGDSTTERCTQAGQSYEFLEGISLKDKLGNLFTFELDTTESESQKISSNSAALNVPLTDDRVTVTGLSFICTRPSQYGAPIISVSFTIAQRGDPQRHEQEDSLDWATNIKLRNQ